jgi:hypothetical protein
MLVLNGSSVRSIVLKCGVMEIVLMKGLAGKNSIWARFLAVDWMLRHRLVGERGRTGRW